MNQMDIPYSIRMEQDEIDKHIKIINNMSQVEMAKMWRFTESGHIYFDCTLPFYKVFSRRFSKLGGMTPEISKSIGW